MRTSGFFDAFQLKVGKLRPRRKPGNCVDASPARVMMRPSRRFVTYGDGRRRGNRATGHFFAPARYFLFSMNRLHVLVIALALAVPGPGKSAAPFTAGAATTDITPPT